MIPTRNTAASPLIHSVHASEAIAARARLIQDVSASEAIAARASLIQDSLSLSASEAIAASSLIHPAIHPASVITQSQLCTLTSKT